MLNLTNSKKTTIEKIDNGAYHSFNAYVRPKRVKSEYRLNPNARVINLDPTDDPNEVCNAYREIQIQSQLARIAKNEQRIAERRRIAEQAAAAAKTQTAQTAFKRAAAQRAYRENSVMSKRRIAIIERMKNGGFLLTPESVSMRNTAIIDVSIIRQEQTLDVVSITSAGVIKGKGGLAAPMWGIDKFKRPPKSIYSHIPISSRTELKRIIFDALSEGCLLQIKDVNAATSSIRGVISTLRKDGFLVCTVRNSGLDAQARGWIIPSAANRLIESAFFSMTDIQKA